MDLHSIQVNKFTINHQAIKSCMNNCFCLSKHFTMIVLLIKFSCNLNFSVDPKYKQESKVIWQKGESPTCHRSRLRMDSSDHELHLIHGSLDPLESATQTASRSVHPFCTAHPCAQHRQTHTDHATCRLCGLTIDSDDRWWLSDQIHALNSLTAELICLWFWFDTSGRFLSGDWQ